MIKVTSDLSEFGWRELKMARDLIDAWEKQGLPDDFLNEGVTISFNTHSGVVFLTNSEFQTAFMNGEKLETWYSCPYCGHEGFQEEMRHIPEDPECDRYQEEIGLSP